MTQTNIKYNVAAQDFKLTEQIQGRLVSAVERVTPLGFYGSGSAPAIRLCLIYPGRGRATRRRTAANASDAIETKEGGWCWTSQTAIGWGPLPKRDLSR